MEFSRNPLQSVQKTMREKAMIYFIKIQSENMKKTWDIR